MSKQVETDVLVIGGGATGAGIAWDLTLRAARVLLVEMGDLSTGTSGRYHGLLHSGGRYAVRDPESAKECIDENRILRRIAPHVLEDTGGYFVLCPDDDESYAAKWRAACAQADIPVREIPVRKALQAEPVLNPDIQQVFEVPDGSCDSWDLAHALQKGCEDLGTRFLTYHQVLAFHREGRRITGARVENLRSGETFDIGCAVAVIAAGPWSAQLAALAGADFKMKLSRGAMLAFNIRWVNRVINKLRPPGDGDILVPVGTVSVTGTTSVPTDDPADIRVEQWEVQRILSETEAMAPGISKARILRAWAGVRPLYDPGQADAGRGAARTFAVLDHEEAEGIGGLVTIVGGKLTTFRLMAEKTADIVCRKLNVTTPCVTASTELPVVHGRQGRYHRLQDRLGQLEHHAMPGALICECELVTASQIQDALRGGDVVTLNDLRRDLRVGMGPCQGGFCAFRTAALRHEFVQDTPENTRALLLEFAERRFGGMRPLLWGHNLRQALLAEHLYQRVLGITETQTAQTVPEFQQSDQGLPDGTGVRIVVVGAGLAGLMAAWAAARMGARVQLIAQGQGTLPLYPGWLEIGDVRTLAEAAGHPYAVAGAALPLGLGLLDEVVGLQSGPFRVVSAMGTRRPVAFGAGGTLVHLKPADRVLVTGFKNWRDFYPFLIADNLRAAGFEAQSLLLDVPQRANFDNWPFDIANLLDREPEQLIRQVRPKLGGATVVGFPAVLGFKPETRKRLAEALGRPVFEIPTLPPSVPGARMYQALRSALLEHGVRFTLGPHVTGLNVEGGRVTGISAQTASGRGLTLRGDAVILCTGGLYGGGLASDYLGSIWEPLARLPVKNVPPMEEWFATDFLSGKAQPLHFAGSGTDNHLRPLSENGQPAALNLFVAGRQLAGYSPVAEGSAEGVDIATGVFAAQQAIMMVKT